MKKILIVSRDISIKQDGGTLVAKRNERLLQQLGFITERFVIPIPSMRTRLYNVLFRQSYGETHALKKDFIEKLQHINYDYIFFDGSIYGGFLKLAYDLGNTIICFYHNVEVEYYRQKALQSKLITDKLMVSFIQFNERLSTKYANAIITLNNRDSNLLHSFYNRNADIIIPTSLPYRNIASLYSNKPANEEPFVLFVGTKFFANIEGLERFIYRIAPKINIKCRIAGNINEAFKTKSNIPANIDFLGRVDSLDDYYINASAVIAPIFTGSGLKTKTVEALSFGKTVIGFPEAFEGIEYENYHGACISVNTDAEFVKALQNINSSKQYNKMSEKLFQEKFSDNAQLEALQNFFLTLR
jgi:hypothetical protein